MGIVCEKTENLQEKPEMPPCLPHGTAHALQAHQRSVAAPSAACQPPFASRAAACRCAQNAGSGDMGALFRPPLGRASRRNGEPRDRMAALAEVAGRRHHGPHQGRYSRTAFGSAQVADIAEDFYSCPFSSEKRGFFLP